MSDDAYEVLSGRYELHRRLASGGTADVFLARDQLLNRPVAVKILSATLSEDEEFVRRLRREAQVVASLNHQNIVGVFDQGEHERAPFIVMEYVEGRSLADILRSEGPIAADKAAGIAVDVAAALDAAHRQGMVHMDVKPGNVLITEEGQVKLADFGIAKALIGNGETDLTSDNGTVMGTATYLSPEQAQGRKVGPRSDVYSLAVVLYEMLTGSAPFVGDSPAEIARKHVEAAPRPPRESGRDIAESLQAITLKAMAKDPAKRYPTVRDFAADLKRYLGGAHSLGKKQAAAAAVATPPVVRPVTGRSTPPETDATQVIPTQAAAAAATPEPLLAPAQPAPRQAAPGYAQEPVPITATAVQDRPAAEQQQQPPRRSDDTWKRNALFFVALLGLLVLLGFLFQALIATLRTDDSELQPVDDPLVDVATVTVEDYFDLERDQAIAIIAAMDLEPVVTAEPNTDVAEGRVFSQNPVAGAIVEAGSQIQITVSQADGMIEVPPLVSLNSVEAERTLRRLGFTPDIQEVDNDIFGPGEVISQDPLPGVPAERGSVVFIEVSLGPSERTIPSLAGVDFNDALSDLFELDFRTTVIDEADPELEEGLVIRTEPAAGSLLRGGENVTIFVSSGVEQILVPRVEGLLADSARQSLIALGFEVIEDRQEVDDPARVNTVIAQSPPPDIQLGSGETVTIVIGIEAEGDDDTTTTVDPGDGTAPTTQAPAPDTTTTAPTTTAAPDTTTTAPTTTAAPAEDGAAQ